ncbi:hypothetical protein SAMN05660845_1848 [Flavobacterium swingsii]|jgi:hypothetical protein|uniref:Glutaminyl-tRNA synthetase n=1 Tax=Flavobacterium swingsii TaxID=498292 RepID=A0A1I0YNU1_9FLAO|nr:DUF6370 family protein [Flavobacterium swingsii]SFB14446.1 hypothetical protein SAMN05660845_1848 [Flavobacterium swingsii]
MKKTFSLLLLFTAFLMNAQEKKNAQKTQFVEVSCGQCKFGMKSGGCDLAVRIDGKSYFVDGVKIDQHGDAHAKDGFCEAIRDAEVVGQVKNNRFVVSYFKLLPKEQ